ncbi:bifunctional protein tyrosine phosphatase family protein/NAD(P)/FAD-dependent oxidoreductase [Hyphomicrobium sp.]|uniref:bifunctional protein tyrosine phosphatase family protein/NAD(P)/FAD-dependent oxidoreductase n=1 Tax=Hyphomicrobium sp. TaxID=82 RepID=UPI000FA1C06F|nr:bifunctional protein tyrosine phosphatase family protein/NAD(P)/FAD-dependent oxidoreductase [Hyphomicrobium sp.]RUP08631.1 MAG: TIGR01244 family phosphatase [Hyphomicrobium sp.]
MSFKALSPTFSVAPQLTEADVAEAAKMGFRSIVSNRPDGEEMGQPTAADISSVAKRNGLAFAHVPVVAGKITSDDANAMREALAHLPRPILAFCRSGTRSATLWALADSDAKDPAAAVETAKRAGYDLSSIMPALERRAKATRQTTYDILIVGGGSAGISTAASLRKRNRKISIAVIDPAETHYYQPGWTLVGAGVFSPEQTRHSEASVIPNGVEWIQAAVTDFLPEQNQVQLADGRVVKYHVLVAAPGIKLAWDAIPGLAEALGSNGVTSNYRYDLAPYTYRLVREFRRGRALFTQPPMPIKCAGAPQKAMYLSCDIWSDARVLQNIDVEFHNAGAVLFGVPAYVPALESYIKRYGIDLRLESKLVAVDGQKKIATLERKTTNGSVERIEQSFDLLHAVPPQVAPEFVARSVLAGPSGFIEVDPATLQHVRYQNVFALGDVAGTSNAKTAAAARKQAPVVAVNALAVLEGKRPAADYNGYGSCPLTVERGKIVLAEFGYGGKLLPSFPTWLIDGTRPSRTAWFLKERLLPPIYWRGMLKGREWMVHPHLIEKPA